MEFFKNLYLKYRIKWYCDNCEAHLNKQEGFNTKTGRWKCTSCGYDNDVTAEYVGKGNKLKLQQENKRLNTKCKFEGAVSQKKFIEFARTIESQIKRMQINVIDAVIIGTVNTISGIDSWEFKVDFNDFGKISGKYWWIYCENYDSKIPNIFAAKMSKLIGEEIERFYSKSSNNIE